MKKVPSSLSLSHSKSHMPNVNASKGNALFLILIAVALFAALSYAMTSSGRGGGNGVARETLRLEISGMLQYGSALEQAISRILLVNGCTDATLNFYSTKFVLPSAYNNDDAPESGACDVFAATGGGVTFLSPPATAVAAGGTEYLINKSIEITGLGRDDGTDTDQELLLMTEVSRDMCMAINTQAGIANPGGEPFDYVADGDVDIHSNTTGDAYTGTYFDYATLGNSGGETIYAGKNFGCYYRSADGNYLFYYVVLAR
jgi:hypothetical protein